MPWLIKFKNLGKNAAVVSYVPVDVLSAVSFVVDEAGGLVW
jgi:hypothetical protein